MLNKKVLAVLMALVLIFAMSACGDNNFTAQDTEEPAVQEEAVTEETADIPVPVSENGTRQTVTIKAESDGTPISARLKTSGEDMEETVDVGKLPFKVKIRYFLEGEELTADEIKGKTGNVRIRFDYENNAETTVNLQGKEVLTKVPFAFISIVTLPEDKLYNVEVNSGSVTESSGSRLIYGYALPGIKDELKLDAAKNKIENLGSDISMGSMEDFPEYLEITGYASDFDMDFTATLVTNGLLRDTEEGKFTDISDALSDLGDAGSGGDELADGVSELKDGADKFGSGLDKYVEGAGGLKDGADALSQGMGKLSEGAASLKEGADGLASGLNSLDENSENLVNGASVIKEGLAGLLEAYKEGSGDEPEGSSIDVEAISSEIGAGTESAVLDALLGNEAMTEEEKNALAKAAGDAAKEKALSEIQNINQQAEGGESEKTDLTHLIQGLMDASSELENGISSYTSGVSQAAEGASGLKEGASQLANGIGELGGGFEELSDGAGSLASSGKELTKGYSKLESGIGSLKKGVDELNKDVFKKVASLSVGELPETLDSLKAMRLADKGFTAWDTYDGEEGSIIFILETE